MTKSLWRRGSQPDAEERPFDAATTCWVSITASDFFFEPYCTDFKPSEPGSLVVACGPNETRHRGVEVRYEGGQASVWVPAGRRAFWLPNLVVDEGPDQPWETRLVELDPETGQHLLT